jgi:C4-type Zn-finger protein
MGMRKRRCPVCGKLKRFAEGSVTGEDEPRPWRVVDYQKVCASCADRQLDSSNGMGVEEGKNS